MRTATLVLPSVEDGGEWIVQADSAEAAFVFGYAERLRGGKEALLLLVDGHPHPLRTGPAAGPGRQAGRIAFWGTVPIRAGEAGSVISLELWRLDETELTKIANIGELQAVNHGPAMADWDEGLVGPETIVVCMATYQPDERLFQKQIASLIAQDEKDWVCIISDDRSEYPTPLLARTLAQDDPRFFVSSSDRRLGFYGNFERALRMVPHDAGYVALCDQDDDWYPEKLSTLRSALSGSSATLAYSDQRLVNQNGRVHRNSMWIGRSNNHSNLTSMVVANSVTGAACLFKRELLDVLIPFPQTPALDFHDHWIGLVALALGDVEYVPRPLYDYVQHDGAVFGDVVSNPRRNARALAGPRRLLGAGRAAYFCGYVAREVLVETLLLRTEFTPAIPPEKRARLEQFLRASSYPLDTAKLALRSLRPLLGRNETLGTESDLVLGIVWSWLCQYLPRRLAPGVRIPAMDEFVQMRLRRWRSAGS